MITHRFSNRTLDLINEISNEKEEEEVVIYDVTSTP